LKRVCAYTAVSLVLSLCGTVFGAVSGEQFSITPMIGGYTYDGNQHLATAPMYSLRGGYSFTDNIGVEAGVDYSITNSTLMTDKNVAIFKYGVEGLYHFMPDRKFVPFVALGLGGYNLSGPSVFVSRKEMGFMDYGAGVKYFFNDRVALRADVRQVLANAGAFEYTLGVTIPFGGVKDENGPMPTYASIKAALAEMRKEQTETAGTAGGEAKPGQAAPQAGVTQKESRSNGQPPAETPAQQKEPISIEVTLGANDAHPAVRGEQAAAPRPEVQEQGPGSKPVQENLVPEKPVLPAVVAPAEQGVHEPSPSDRLARMKVEFAREELERITVFKTDWEKQRESRLAAEKAAMQQEALDQVRESNEQSVELESRLSAGTAVPAAKPAASGAKAKSTQKKRHRKATARKRHIPATVR